MLKFIKNNDIFIRKKWIEKIYNLKGDFSKDFNFLEKELENEIEKGGLDILVGHLRLCGNIPEKYGHDTTEEKMYSKYTDALLHFVYKNIGLNSLIISERADVADVEAICNDYGFVADAKAFRLSRTAKNQKDFKVQAMDRWKHGKDFAMVVCPIYQLPKTTSQIYYQAISRNVCIFTYSHLILLLLYSKIKGKEKTKKLLEKIFKSISLLNPSKDAIEYWKNINQVILEEDEIMLKLWSDEKIASEEAIYVAKEEGLTFLSQEREKIMKLSHSEALKELLNIYKIDNKIKVINKISDNGLFNIK